jgi:hypothetical protein
LEKWGKDMSANGETITVKDIERNIRFWESTLAEHPFIINTTEQVLILETIDMLKILKERI